MPLSKEQKQTRVDALRQELAQANAFILGGFDHLTVAQDLELRRAIRAAGGRYRVLKNTLAARAAQGTAAQELLQGLRGVNSLAYTQGDAVALAKAMRKYAKDNPAITYRAAWVEGRLLNAAAIDQLAALPPREEVMAKLLYMLQAPAQRLATAVAAVGRQTAVVLDQGVKQGKFPG